MLDAPIGMGCFLRSPSDGEIGALNTTRKKERRKKERKKRKKKERKKGRKKTKKDRRKERKKERKKKKNFGEHLYGQTRKEPWELAILWRFPHFPHTSLPHQKGLVVKCLY